MIIKDFVARETDDGQFLCSAKTAQKAGHQQHYLSQRNDQTKALASTMPPHGAGETSTLLDKNGDLDARKAFEGHDPEASK